MSSWPALTTRAQARQVGSRLAIAFFDCDGGYRGQIESNWLSSGTTSDARLVASGQVPAAASYARIYLKSTRNLGTVWFGDVSYEAR